MQPFTILTGIAAPLPMINVDTDMIIPKQFLKTIKRSGLGKSLFFEMRYDDAGNEIADFVLNRPAFRNAEILIAGENFGCGSSREHAPWALLDFGIRCVIAPSFADIFYNNCFKNGILPIVLPREQVGRADGAGRAGRQCDLHRRSGGQVIAVPDGGAIPFEIDPFRKACLLGGLDDIGLTLQKVDHIAAFEARQLARASPGSRSEPPPSRNIDPKHQKENRHVGKEAAADPRRRRHRPGGDERGLAGHRVAGRKRGLGFELRAGLVGGAAIDAHGVPLTDETMAEALAADAVLLGAVGGPKWDPLPFEKKPERGLLRLRKEMELFANLRPAVVFDALVDASPLKPEIVRGLDIMIVRELTGGVYFGEPRGIDDLPDGGRRGVNTQVYTTEEIGRIARVAFELARKRQGRVCSVEKANVMEIGRAVARGGAGAARRRVSRTSSSPTCTPTTAPCS